MSMHLQNKSSTKRKTAKSEKPGAHGNNLSRVVALSQIVTARVKKALETKLFVTYI